jgi:XTP/dITP diphosphohydrolase
MKTLCLATNNAHKIGELRDILAPVLPEGVRLVSLDEAGGPWPDAPENEPDFEGNAVFKARWYAERTGLPTLADDSGLCVDCLDGRPGLKSARYAPTNEERIARVLREVAEAELLAGDTGDGAFSRAARFVCVMACWRDGHEPLIVRGEVEGVIREELSGEGGFGYDPIFGLPDLGKSMAELAPEEKNGLSHRGRAARAMAAELGKIADLL